MFGTFIVDAYKQNEAEEIADALEGICSPKDMVGWASTGIYSFWNYYTKEIYYVGLARDLGDRFKQHNGIVPTKDKSCKKQQINTYFAQNEKLGYTIFVQSPLAQAQTHKNKSRVLFDDDSIWISEESIENIEIIEGSFIEALTKRHGRLPQWNKNKGSAIGQQRATLEMSWQLEDCITGNLNDLLIARSSLREIAQNAVFEWYEINLHAARMLMLSRHISFDEAISMLLAHSSFFNQAYNEIVPSLYLEKRFQI